MEQRRTRTVGKGPRGYMEISYSVLSASLNGALRTHIMFRCNLNSRQLHVYLQSLLDKGLIESRRDPPSAKVEYMTTQKGRKYVEIYNSLAEMINETPKYEQEAYA